MGLLTPARRVYHRWRNVLPLQDGRSCPDCGAVVCGREDRRVHRERHMQERAWQEWVADSLMSLAKFSGHPVAGLGGDQAEGDGYGRVDLTAAELDDDEEDDEDE